MWAKGLSIMLSRHSETVNTTTLVSVNLVSEANRNNKIHFEFDQERGAL